MRCFALQEITRQTAHQAAADTKLNEYSPLDLPRLTKPAHTGQSPEASVNTFWSTLFHETGRIMNGNFGISFEKTARMARP